MRISGIKKSLNALQRRLFRHPDHNAQPVGIPLDRPSGNVYGVWEWAGAFGDLGTFITFVVAYISPLKMEPSGISKLIFSDEA